MTIRLAVLGPPIVENDGRRVTFDTRKALALLAYLATLDGSCSRESLVALLWPTGGSERGRSALRRTLSTIRSALGSDAIATSGDQVGLNPDRRWSVDLREYRELRSAAVTDRHTAPMDLETHIDALARATALYRGEFLAGFGLKDSVAFDDWQLATADQLSYDQSDSLRDLARLLLETGRLNDALRAANARLALDPLDETSHVLVMEIRIASGNPAAAIRQFEECERILAAELGIEPSPKARAIRESIRRRLDGLKPDSFPQIESTGLTVLHAAVAYAFFGAPGESGVGSELNAGEAARRSAEVVATHYGTTAELRSGGWRVMVFASLQEPELNPELAVRAALALRTRAAAGGFRWKIAVGSAFASLPDTGMDKETASSARFAAARTALRLVREAQEYGCVADERTYRLTRLAVIYAAGRLQLGEGDRRFHARAIDSLAHHGAKTRGFSFRAVAMYGRDDAVRSLVDAYERSKSGRAHFFPISGAAGIGKSRLVRELARHIGAHSDQDWPIWLRGRALPPPVHAPFVAFVQAIRPYLDVLERPSIAARVDPPTYFARELARATGTDASRLFGIGATLAHLSAVADAVADAVATAGDSASAPSAPAGQDGVDALVSTLSHCAEASSVVLHLDDFHWADLESIAVVRAVATRLPTARILVIYTFRPFVRDEVDHLASFLDHVCPGQVRELRLGRLSVTDAALLHSAHQSVRHRAVREVESLLERAGGNPWYVEELAYTQGYLPRSVVSALIGTLWSLPEDERALLRDLAAGRTTAVAGNATSPALRSLLRKGLVIDVASGGSPKLEIADRPLAETASML